MGSVLDLVQSKDVRELLRPYVTELGWKLSTANKALRLTPTDDVLKLNPDLAPFIMVHQTANGGRALSNLRGDIRKYKLPEQKKEESVAKTQELASNKTFFCTVCGINDSPIFHSLAEREMHMTDKHPTSYTLTEAMALVGLKPNKLSRTVAEIIAALSVSPVESKSGTARSVLEERLPSLHGSKKKIGFRTLPKLEEAGVITCDTGIKRTYRIALKINVVLTDEEKKKYLISDETPVKPDPPKNEPVTDAFSVLGVLYPSLPTPSSLEELEALNNWVSATSRLIETFGPPS